MEQPSVHSRDLSRVLQERLDENESDDPLLLPGCYLNPRFREMEFVSNDGLRAEFKFKAEEFARKLGRKSKERVRMNSFGDDVLDVDEIGPEDMSSEIDVRLPNSVSSNRIGGKKRTFDLFKYADTVFTGQQILDEVSKYNMLGVDHLRQDQKNFLVDDFSITHSWYNRKAQFPNFFSVAARIYAAPVSLAASESVFSALDLCIDYKRSCLSTFLIADMIVVHSLHE